jgi:acetyltransferase-like isoleucine patch superfamily enzyme
MRERTAQVRRRTVGQRLAYRAYLGTMRIESLWALRLRRTLLQIMTGRKSSHLNVFPHVFIDGAHALKLGDHISINRECHISAAGGLEIGDYVSIGHDTSILTTNHGWKDADKPIKYQPITYEPVCIGSNVWIGAKVCILAGVTIPSGSIVAAGAIVTKSFDKPDTIIGGVPARVIKSRFGR